MFRRGGVQVDVVTRWVGGESDFRQWFLDWSEQRVTRTRCDLTDPGLCAGLYPDESLDQVVK